MQLFFAAPPRPKDRWKALNTPYSRKSQNGAGRTAGGIVAVRTIAAGIPKTASGMADANDEVGAEVDLPTVDLFAKRFRSRRTRGGTTCCVPGCYNNSKEDAGRVSFYRFPLDRAGRLLWLARIGRDRKWRPSVYSRVCGSHFVGGLKSTDAPHPILFPLRDERRYRSGIDSQRRGRRTLLARHKPTSTVTTAVSEIDDLATTASKQALEGGVVVAQSESDCDSLSESSYGNNALKEVEELRQEIGRLHAQVDKLLRVEFCLGRFRHYVKGFHYYTGLPDFATFRVIFKWLLNPHAEKIRQYDGRSGVQGKARMSFHRRTLTQEEEFFCFLCILRRGLDQEDMGDRLGISQSTVCRIWNTWLRVTYDRLCQVPIWLPKSKVEERMPPIFKKHFPKTRVILDCTDIFIEMPSAFRAQNETYSIYKHHNTAKGLVTIAPHGAVVFASKLYGGRTSDKAIASHCGMLDKLEEGDAVMADRGFEIEDILPKGVTLVSPSFMEKRPQLPVKEEVHSRQVAAARIHVERVIRRIKTFRILSGLFPLKMKPSLDMVWQVCARLSNFAPPPIADGEKRNDTEKSNESEEDGLSSPSPQNLDLDADQSSSDNVCNNYSVPFSCHRRLIDFQHDSTESTMGSWHCIMGQYRSCADKHVSD